MRAQMAETIATLSAERQVAPAGEWSSQADKVWCLKRDWTDLDFQAGAEANAAQLQSLEDELIARLRQSCSKALHHEASAVSSGDVLARVLDPAVVAFKGSRPPEAVREAVLNDPEVLGSSLDIVGAYLKNYEVDRAARVMETVIDVCRARGGLWRLKALNHLATVRMKQARPAEALVLLEETEAVAAANLRPEDNDEAWEFWETVYRNFGWVLSSLDRGAEAVKYIEQAVAVKERVGRPASWFDLWDLGRMKAALALKNSRAADIEVSAAVVTRALWLHRDAEPSDLVMRAKIWHSVGECSFALGHLAEGHGVPGVQGGGTAGSEPSPATSSKAISHYKKSLKCFKESHKLFKKTEGPHNPLTGGEAEATAWAMIKLGADGEAKEYLFDALEALSKQQSGWGEGDRAEKVAPALAHGMQTVDRILHVHRRTDDREGLTRYFSAIERLCANVCGRLRIKKDRVDSAVYERLVSSCSMVMVASGTEVGQQKSQELIQTYLWDAPDTAQAKLCSQMLRSVRDRDAGSTQEPTEELMRMAAALAAGGKGG